MHGFSVFPGVDGQPLPCVYPECLAAEEPFIWFARAGSSCRRTTSRNEPFGVLRDSAERQQADKAFILMRLGPASLSRGPGSASPFGKRTTGLDSPWFASKPGGHSESPDARPSFSRRTSGRQIRSVQVRNALRKALPRRRSCLSAQVCPVTDTRKKRSAFPCVRPGPGSFATPVGTIGL